MHITPDFTGLLAESLTKEYGIKNEIDIEQFKLQLLKCYLDAYSYLTNKKLILSSDELDTITYSGLVDYLKIQSMQDIF